MKILVATDGSRTSRTAVRLAAVLAAKCNRGSLTVITVGRLPSRRWLVRPRPGRRNPGRPTGAAQAIVRESALQASDLIALGNAGRSAVNDLVLGSVAQRVLDLSRRPVVLVRASSRGRR